MEVLAGLISAEASLLGLYTVHVTGSISVFLTKPQLMHFASWSHMTKFWPIGYEQKEGGRLLGRVPKRKLMAPYCKFCLLTHWDVNLVTGGWRQPCESG